MHVTDGRMSVDLPKKPETGPDPPKKGPGPPWGGQKTVYGFPGTPPDLFLLGGGGPAVIQPLIRRGPGPPGRARPRVVPGGWGPGPDQRCPAM